MLVQESILLCCTGHVSRCSLAVSEPYLKVLYVRLHTNLSSSGVMPYCRGSAGAGSGEEAPCTCMFRKDSQQLHLQLLQCLSPPKAKYENI